jgi:hypothetical protein
MPQRRAKATNASWLRISAPVCAKVARAPMSVRPTFRITIAFPAARTRSAASAKRPASWTDSSTIATTVVLGSAANQSI